MNIKIPMFTSRNIGIFLMLNYAVYHIFLPRRASVTGVNIQSSFDDTIDEIINYVYDGYVAET